MHERGFAGPGNAAQDGEAREGYAQSYVFEIVRAASFENQMRMVFRNRPAAAAQRGDDDIRERPPGGRVRMCYGFRFSGFCLRRARIRRWRPLIDHFAAEAPGTRPEVDEVVRAGDRSEERR